MALTFTKVRRFPHLKGGFRTGIVDVTLDGAYVNATGWSITAANLKLRRILNIRPPACRSGYVFEWDQVNAKLKCYYGDYSNGSDGVLVEVPTNHAGVNNLVIRCEYIGS